jgi:hypothetical protein
VTGNRNEAPHHGFHDDFHHRLSALLLPAHPTASEAELLERVRHLLERERDLSAALTELAEAVFHTEHYHDAPQDVRRALDEAQRVLGL